MEQFLVKNLIGVWIAKLVNLDEIENYILN